MKKFVSTIFIIIFILGIFSYFRNNSENSGVTELHGSINQEYIGEYELSRRLIDGEEKENPQILSSILVLYPNGNGFFMNSTFGGDHKQYLKWVDGQIGQVTDDFSDLIPVSYSVEGDVLTIKGKDENKHDETLIYKKTKRIEKSFVGHYVMEKIVKDDKVYNISESVKEKSMVDLNEDGTGRVCYQEDGETFDENIFWNDKEFIMRKNDNYIINYRISGDELVIAGKSDDRNGFNEFIVFKKQ